MRSVSFVLVPLALFTLSVGCNVSNSEGEGKSDTAATGTTGTTDGSTTEAPDEDGDGVAADTDCDDADPAVGGPQPRWLDGDADGYGDVHSELEPSCTVGAGEVLRHGDCDDTRADIHPEAAEICDGIDNDCDRLVDDADDSITDQPLTIYVDADGDGFGDPDRATPACALRDGFVDNSLDCDDRRPGLNPDMEELCSTTFDEDCDGGFGEACGVYSLLPEEADDTGSADDEDAEEIVILPYTDLVEFYGEHSGRTGHTSAEPFDLNDDGFEDAIVGNPYFSTPAEDAGTLTVIWGAERWPQDSTTEAAVRNSEDRTGLGRALTTLDDFTGDGRPELIATDDDGVWLLEPGAAVQGSAELIDDIATWGLSNAEGALSARWVESGGDINADGLADLMVARGRSEVVVLFGSTDRLEGSIDDHVALRLWSDSDTYDAAKAHAFTGTDIDGDGFSDLLIGAPVKGAYAEGSVMIYSGADLSSGTERTHADADLELTDELRNYEELGSSAAAIGDFNHDGYEDFVIGLDALNPAAIFAGEALWFSPDREWVHGPGAPTTEDAALLVDVTSTGSRHTAEQVRLVPDLTGDGYPDLLLDVYAFMHFSMVLAGGEGWEQIDPVPQMGWRTPLWGDRSNTIAVDYTGTSSPYFTFPRTDYYRPRAPIQVAPIPGF